MYRDVSTFFTYARIVRLSASRSILTPAWTECCTNGRCNSCK